MQKQRGSVTVIAIVMLLFLMVVAIAWLPMMTIEKTAASSDYREQQAWDAAEAGYKKAVAALDNKNSNWTWLTPENYIQGSDSGSFGHLSIDGGKADQNGIWYAVGITENNIDLASDYTPEESAAYQITSVGACQGIRKVIRKVHTLGDNGGTGGGEEPEQPPDAYINDSFITSSGALIINNDIDYDPNNKVYYSGYFGDYTVGGQVINKEFVTEPKYKSAASPEVFEKATYPELQSTGATEDRPLSNWNITNGQYWAAKASFAGTKISVANNTVLLIGEQLGIGYMLYKNFLTMDNVEITVPKGKTLEFIICDYGTIKDYDNVVLKNITIKGGGQVSFISGGSIAVNSIKSVDNSRILFIANKNLSLSDPFINADKQLDGGCFLSSAGNMQMLVSGNVTATFYGQMQSAGLISIGGQSGSTGKLVLRFNKIGEKLKMPNMYYLRAA